MRNYYRVQPSNTEIKGSHSQLRTRPIQEILNTVKVSVPRKFSQRVFFFLTLFREYLMQLSSLSSTIEYRCWNGTR